MTAQDHQETPTAPDPRAAELAEQLAGTGVYDYSVPLAEWSAEYRPYMVAQTDTILRYLALIDAAPRAVTEPLGKLLSTVDLAIDAFDPMAPDWPNFEKSVVALRALKQARALLSVGDKAEAPLDPTKCEVCGKLADGEPGRCHRHFRRGDKAEAPSHE